MPPLRPVALPDRSRRLPALAAAVALAGGLAIVGGGGAAPEPTQAPAVDPWPGNVVVPVAVEGGRADFDVPGAGPGSRTLVIVSAMSRQSGHHPITLRAYPADRVRPLRRADDGPAGVATRPGPPPPLAIPSRPGPVPPTSRTFHLLVRDGDPAGADNYLPVEGRLRAVGAGIQVYVDARDVDEVGPEVLRDLVATFDREILPTAAAEIGTAHDVDGDGRFTVLMSSWLSRLAGGRVRVDGFVRGSDLDPSLGPPFGNRCDMMYLNATLGAGPHLRTVAAHEYTHAVTFSRKVLDAPGRRGGYEEEGWLDEALAHLAEDRHGFSRTNLDYRVSAFLSRPERYRLVVEDYYAADLFRSHGNRGGTYLFLRWCADRFGPDLLPALVRSPERGVANLEAATGTNFAALFRRWTAALYLTGLEVDREDPEAYRSLELRHAVDDWILAGPRATHVEPGGEVDAWSAEGTSCHFSVVAGSPGGAVRVTVEGPPEARLQVSAVPLPREMARLDLSVRLTAGPDSGLRGLARVSGRDGRAVRLSALAWEPLVPAADPRSAAFRRDGLDMLGIASSFGTSALPPGGTLASKPIPLPGVRPGDGPLIFKVVGTDDLGRRVAAWAEVTPPRPAGGD